MHKNLLQPQFKGLISAGLIVLLICMQTAVFAESGGINGYSGEFGSTCTSCHNNTSSLWSANPIIQDIDVSLITTDPDNSSIFLVTPGSTGNSFRVNATSANSTRVGVDLSANGGTLVDQTDRGHIEGSNELTHDSPQTPANAFWDFDWDAPSTVGTYTFYWCNNLVDFNGFEFRLAGDGGNRDHPVCRTQQVKVNTDPNAVNDTINTVNEDSTGNCLSILSNDTSGTSGNETGDSISLVSLGTPTQGGTVTLGNGFTCAITQVRYTPDADFDGTETFTYTIQDSFSQAGFADTATVTVNIVASNDAPTLSGVNATNSYTENVTPGTIIDSTIVADDVDSFCNQATIDLTTGYQNGQDILEYTGSILNVSDGGFSAASGILTLTAPSGTVTCANMGNAMEGVRYRNTSDNPTAGSRTVLFRVGDDDGGFSPATSTAGVNTTTLSVIAVNDAPTIDVDGAGSYIENASPGTIIDGSIGLTDPENNNITGATVSITGNFNNTQDQLVYSTTNGVTGSYNSSTGVLTLTHASGTSTTLFAQAMQAVRYFNSSDNPTTGMRTISFVVTDNGTTNGVSDPESSNTDTATVTITPTNDAPVIAGGSPQNRNTNEDVDDDFTLTASDAEGNTITWSVSLAPTNGDVTGATGDGTSKNITYTPDLDYTGDDTFEITVSDGTDSTTTVFDMTVDPVQDPPAITGVDFIPAYTENGTPIVIDSDVEVDDTDSPMLSQATVSITGGFVSAEDRLVYSTVNGISGSYSTGTGVLTLSHAGATLLAFEQALETVAYENISNNPNTATRTISYVVRDTNNASSDPDTTTLTISNVNDVPVLDVNGADTYVENATPGLIIDGSIGITDGESNSITGATVSIMGNFNSAQDQLVYSTTNGVTGSYNSGTGVLTLTHAGTTLALFEQALEAVRYFNNSDNPTTGTRTISFAVTDNGTTGGVSNPGTSNPDTATVAISLTNDVPVIGDVDATPTYTENEAAVVIDSIVSISDADSTELDQARVSIAADFDSSQDSLVFTDANGIEGAYDDNTGILTLTATSGSAPLTDFEQALESVCYQNSSDAPAPLTRTIAMAVRDTGGGISVADTTILSIDDQNDPPVAADDSGPDFNVQPNSAGNELNVLANDTDVDPGDTAALSLVSFTDVTNAGASLALGDGDACAVDTICYTPPPGYTGVYIFDYVVEDTSGATDTGRVTVDGTDTDGDTVTDHFDNCDNVQNLNQANNDGDAFGDLCDDDDDNDGMPDTFEQDYEDECGLDPFDAADATEDCDSDGLNNAGEAAEDSDPTVDDVSPVFSGVQDITVNSTGYLTPVNLGNVRAVDGAEGLMVISVDGVTGPTAQSDALNGLFRPGRTEIERSAEDSLGNATTSTQTIDVLPLANFAPDQVTVEGGAATIEVLLNGEPPEYPVTLDYAVSGTSNGSDHDAVNGTVTINDPDIFGNITVNFANDGAGDNNETLVLTLSNPVNAALGGRRVHTITIAEGNVAPTVTLSIEQGANDGFLITDDPVAVVVTANVSDPNLGDTASFSWSGTPAGTPAGATFTFDPSLQEMGPHSVAVQVTDGGGATAAAQVSLYLIAADDAPVFDPGANTDGDSYDDDDPAEGYSDVDGDGIPNYLDAYEQVSESYLIQNQTGDSSLLIPGVQLANIKLIQTEPGFRIRKGPVAMYINAGGIMLSEDQVVEYAEGNEVPPSSADDDMINIGGIYDFEIYGMLPGATARVVLPLSARILDGARYRKFSLEDGWRDFSTQGDNAIATTRSTHGVCPAPGHSSYRSGLNAFDNCVELTLVDGGPNDADGEANGVISDPGGVAVVDPSPAPEQEETEDGSGGGVLHPFWLLLLMLWGIRLRNKIDKNL